VLNSGLWLFWQKGLLTYTLLPSDVPSSFPLRLNTNSFLTIAPQLPQRFPGANMSLTVNASGQPRIAFDAHGRNEMTTSIPSSLAFSVLLSNGTSVPAFTLEAPVDVANHVWVSKGATPGATEVIHANVTLLQCTPLTVLSSAVGPVKVGAVSSLTGFLLSHVVVPAANKILADGFPIPTSSAGVGLDSVDLRLENDALVVRADFTFSPPLREH